MPSLELVVELEGHADRVWQISWHPKRLALVSCSGDKTARVWSPLDAAHAPASWQCVDVLEGAHDRTIRSVAYSPSGRTIATASFDASTAIWEPTGKDGAFECTATLDGHENEVKSVAWSCNGTLLSTCSRDKSVWIWEVDQQDGDDFECVSVLQEHSQDVKMVAWHPHEELLISASYDDTIRVWREDDDDWYCASVLAGHQSTVWSVDFDKEGRYIVSGSDDNTIKLWKRQTSTRENECSQDASWRCVETVYGQHDRCVYYVSWSKVHHRIATAAGDNHVRVFEVTLYCTKENAHGVTDVNVAVWCPLEEYGHLLATGGDDGVIRVWQLKE
ncbi:putative cytosolic iron-sulfur protein assembly protein Ciao1-like protein [Syncephalis pseudoplumigaleata]|uniref:Probable cytosolic iron-sulfur protein assembly protein 1 n=1 Tax=Syncephalis pseudoplumigaleata TaxID=1712513 RepID=A0A4P9Z5D6_9FUNG|nr:putative cytosolic iron-sulfur protein assembly protein Ciao1-like protein [Syncephalis pseudoplumigaleata]|eukprot:RKP26830.1 putative cytosolic iron-sulfur protein assembly protein Ciao1-like protein [Syncephalis pseudoplumigaleata]